MDSALNEKYAQAANLLDEAYSADSAEQEKALLDDVLSLALQL